MIPDTRNFGPDHQQLIDRNFVTTIRLPRHGKARFTFSSDAQFENCMIVYGEDWREYLVRGNGSRSLSDWTIENTGQVGLLHFTGWHKLAREAVGSGYPWLPSLVQKTSLSSSITQIGYTDGGGSFNDILCRIDRFS